MEIIIRKDNRPYWLKKIITKVNKIYVRQFLEPQFDYLGKGGAYFKPRYIKVFGGNVSINDYPTLIGSKDAHIQFTSWDIGEHKGEIKIGKFCLITPGVRIMSANSIVIGDACMIAHGAYISDADWHGIYDRAEPVGNTKPVVFEDNVWIGDSAIICKGVTIGKNSIIGASSNNAIFTNSHTFAYDCTVANPYIIFKDYWLSISNWLSSIIYSMPISIRDICAMSNHTSISNNYTVSRHNSYTWSN